MMSANPALPVPAPARAPAPPAPPAPAAPSVPVILSPLRTADGERLRAEHWPGPAGPVRPAGSATASATASGTASATASGTVIVLAHGFTGSLDRPAVRAVAAGLAAHAGVLAFDLRGHGASTGRSTLGNHEVLDLTAAVERARELGYERVATCGWSMGGSVVLRHAALVGGVDAVASVSATSRWSYRGTPPMRRVHWVVEHRLGRMLARRLLRVRISDARWDPVPESPVECVARIAPVPVLIVHGDRDGYFPLEHAEALAAAAGTTGELWVVEGFGHAETAATADLLDRIGARLVALAAGA